MRTESRQKVAAVVKFAWYLCASVLILSLPTFSYLLPRQQTGPYPEAWRKPDRVAESAARTGGEQQGVLATLARGAAASWSGEAEESAGLRGPVGAPLQDGSGPAGSVQRSSSAETPWPSVGRFEQRRSRPGPPGGLESPGVGDPRLESGLTDLQQGYEEAFNSLFPDVFYGVRAAGNPFENALGSGGAGSGPDGGPSEPTSGGEPPSSGETANTPPPPTPDTSADGGNGDSGGSGNPDVVDSPATKDPGYNFLVLGDFAGDGSHSGISRARQQIDGQFVLEDASRFSFFPGIVHSLLTFEETEKVMIEDLNGDGILDFVVTTEVPAVGTAIESYVQRSPGQFQLTGTAFLYLQEIRSFALFDFNRDGRDELALALAGHPHLVVYEHVGSEWLYLRELALPIQPALVMSSPVAVGVRTRSLFILDEGLQFVLSSTDRQPEAFRLGSNLPLNHMRRIQVNLSGRPDDPGEVLAFGLADRVVLCDGRGGRLRAFAAVRVIEGSPLMIFGDYARAGTRQTLWLP